MYDEKGMLGSAPVTMGYMAPVDEIAVKLSETTKTDATFAELTQKVIDSLAVKKAEEIKSQQMHEEEYRKPQSLAKMSQYEKLQFAKEVAVPIVTNMDRYTSENEDGTLNENELYIKAEKFLLTLFN